MKRSASHQARAKLIITNLTTVKVNRHLFIKVWQLMTRRFKLLRYTHLSVVIVNPSTIKRLNSIYHGQLKTTDVLSFNYGSAAALWEIIICYPQAKLQAQKQGWSVNQELQLLFIHGLLHQLGFNDYTKQQQLKIDQEQQRWLKKLTKVKLRG